MTGRERLRACLTFARPDRAPRDLWALPAVSLYQKEELEALLRDYPMDIASPQMSPGQSERNLEAVVQGGSYTDEWGSVWQVGEPGVIGEVKAPALADWSKLADFRPPWHLLQERDQDHVNRVCGQSEQFMLSACTVRPFERLQFLCGSEKVLCDLAYGTPELIKLLEMLHEFFLKDIAWWCETGVDGIMMMDDWGSSRSLLISPQAWRAIFKPLYREYCEMIHAAGKFAFFHTDGNTSAIFGELIEVGMDAINSQLFCMDIEDLARRYKGKVTFWGEIDRQHVLPYGTPEEVREAVRRVRRALDDGRGGVIAQCEWGKHNPAENIRAVFQAWLEPV